MSSSAKLKILQRQLNIQPGEKAPVPDSGHGLGMAIEKLIEDMVTERVNEALEKQPVRSPHVRRLEEQLNKPAYIPSVPAPKAPVAKNLSAQLLRDGAGVTRWITMGNLKFEVQRDGADKVIGMRQVDESPVLPPPDIPFKAAARKYNDGEPRS